MILLRYIFLIILLLFTINCTEKTYYSGKILNEKIQYKNFKNKDQLIKQLGLPNYIDPIEKNYYYFSEKSIRKNLINKKIINRTIIVFNFNNDNKIITVNSYNLEDFKKLQFKNDTTKNELIKRGLIKKIFGGVRAQNVPNTP